MTLDGRKAYNTMIDKVWRESLIQNKGFIILLGVWAV